MVRKFLPEDYLNFHYLQSHMTEIRAKVQADQGRALTLFVLFYIVYTGIFLPGASLLSLLAGALFGLYTGFLAALLASTIGASIAFALSKFLFNEFFSRKFFRQAQAINRGLTKNGDGYLLTLRLVPLFPFFIVNILMGLTAIRPKNYVRMTFIGMVPSVFVHVYAGLSFSSISSLHSIASAQVLIALTLLGFFPYLASAINRIYHRYRLKH